MKNKAKQRTVRTYKGCHIYPMGANSWGGRWESYVNGVFIAADTLAGIKQFITERLETDKFLGSL